MRRLVLGALAIAILTLGIFVGRLLGPSETGFRDLSHFNGREESRVTDPSGRFDALVLSETYGPAGGGGVNSYVAIVRKRQPATSAREAVLANTSTRNEKALWREPHLLEIQYDRAAILDFTNLWSTNVLQTGFSTEQPYWVEIRLAPSSPTFSIMTPDGRFR